MSLFLFVMGIFCVLYYLTVILYAGITADFAWIWFLGAGVFSGLGAAWKYSAGHPGFFPGWFRTAAALVIAAGLLVFGMFGAGVLWGMTERGSENLDYVVVLGAQVKGNVPSRALKKRLIKAREYAEQNPGTVLILSGGQGSGEDITEALCMKNFLAENGISEERLVLEEKSTDTLENLKFSDELTGCGGKRTGILSNNFHVYRAVKLAKKLGYTRAEGIAAPSDAVMQVHYIVREVFALVKELFKGRIDLR